MSLRPYNLHISHGWGGGLGRWIDDFCKYDPFSENLVIESVGVLEAHGLGGQLIDGRTGERLRSWTYRHPICEIAVCNCECRSLLESVIAEFDVSHIYVSSLIGHSLDVLDLGKPTTVVHHDYFPYCPALNICPPLACEHCGVDEVKDCFANNPFTKHFNKNSPEYWLKIREAYFALASRDGRWHVYAGSDLANAFMRLDDRYRKLHFTKIEHGIKFTRSNCFGGDKDRKLRVVMLGSLDPRKGLDLLRSRLEIIRLIADIYLVGCGECAPEFADRWGYTVIQQYEHNELPAQLEAIRPDLILLLSVIPETFSYTLSEAFAHGIPPCASKIGSFVERIQHQHNGFLIDLTREDVVDFLLFADKNRECLHEVSRHILGQPIRTVADMILDYYRIRPDWTSLTEKHTVGASETGR